MAINISQRILPWDISTETTSSDHTNISNYANALTNVDSDTYAEYQNYGQGDSLYVKFSSSSIQSSFDTAYFRIKVITGYPNSDPYVRLNIKDTSAGSWYYSDYITVTTTLDTSILEIPLPDDFSVSQLSSAYTIYIQISHQPGFSWFKVFGAELDVGTWSPDNHGIFNLILPAQEDN